MLREPIFIFKSCEYAYQGKSNRPYNNSKLQTMNKTPNFQQIKCISESISPTENFIMIMWILNLL